VIAGRGVKRFMDNIFSDGILNRGKVLYRIAGSVVGVHGNEARDCEGGTTLNESDPARCPELPETATTQNFRHPSRW